MIIISNGFNKFHLGYAAEETYKRDRLSMYITGAFPTKLIQNISKIKLFGRNRKFNRLLARDIFVPINKIHSLWLPEAVSILGDFTDETNIKSQVRAFLFRLSLKEYGRYAKPIINQGFRNGAKIYHYRGGFGHQSAIAAKKLGMFTLCDFSIAHPLSIEKFINGNGYLDPNKPEHSSEIWHDILTDTEMADALLVNSDFVKETFVNQGWDPDRIHIIYWGVDNEFLKFTNKEQISKEPGKPVRFLFAGAFNNRKGGHIIIDAIRKLNGEKFVFQIAGDIPATVLDDHRDFFNNPNVNVLGLLSRAELAQKMMEADVFVFPSLVEGSARVIFEAMACGCFVITTPNSGSVVRDGIHGKIIQPGNSFELAEAIKFSLEHITLCKEIGVQNAVMIKQQYTQSIYGDRLFDLYSRLMN